MKEHANSNEKNSTSDVDILIVDDSSANLELLKELLEEAGYKVRPAISGELGLRSIHASPPVLVLLDVFMPDMDVFEMCKILKADKATQDIPVIFLSASDDEASKIKSFQTGGVDYITKPFHNEEVLARVKTHVQLRKTHLELENINARLLAEIAERKMAEKNNKQTEVALQESASKIERMLWESEKARRALLSILEDEKQTEQELIKAKEISEENVRLSAETLERFRLLFENSPIGKSMTGIDGTLHINTAFAEMLGYSKEELESKNWAEVSYPDDVAEINRYINLMLEGKISQARFEKRYLHKDGSVIWTDVSTYLQRDKEGKPQYFITAVMDITERKEAEEKIRHFNEELETQVRTRTVELNEIIRELEEQTKVFVGRELKMIELKEQIAELERRVKAK